MINNKYLLSALFAVACGCSAMAQEEAFDLTSQRGEKQDVNVVPGKKLDHQGIVVNPIRKVCALQSTSVRSRQRKQA